MVQKPERWGFITRRVHTGPITLKEMEFIRRELYIDPKDYFLKLFWFFIFEKSIAKFNLISCINQARHFILNF